MAIVAISYKYLILSEKGTNPFLTLDTQYAYSGCGRKRPIRQVKNKQKCH